MKIEDIGLWQAFHGVATQGNFSQAAKAMKVGLPQLSKRVGRLEDTLGVRLFTRSTRNVALTDEGRSLLPKVTAMLDEWESLETAFDSRKALSGTIRITSVPFVAHRFLVPVLAKFREQHPLVKFEVELSESMVNLIEANIDLALRIHDDPKDTTLVYRALAPNELVLCASPEYLKRNPAPLKKPFDLRQHQTLILNIHRKVKFKEGLGRLGDFATAGSIQCDNGWYLTELALSGFGILARSRWDVADYLKSGKLVRVLERHPLEPFGNIYAVIPTRKLLAPRIRMLLDVLKSE